MGRNKFHLSLFFLIPLILVLFSIGPLWVTVFILKIHIPVATGGLRETIHWVQVVFWTAGLTALAAGILIAYAIVRPLAQLSHAIQEVASGQSPSRVQVEESGEFAHLGEEFNRMISTLQGQERIRRTERLAALGALAAGVAHEIRNPLGSIRGLAQLLKENPEEAHREKYAQAIVEQTGRLNGALETLLHLARPVNPSRTREDLNRILQKAVGLLGIERGKKEITIVESYDENLPPLEADGEALLQAFFNILLNAIQAIPPGSEISIRTAYRSDGIIQIEVRNTGSVIPAADIDRIFDPFYTTKEDGTGLGLAITHQVVTSHGGTIKVASRNDETVFTLKFPALPPRDGSIPARESEKGARP